MKETRRSTRSQVAPDWNSTDALTLVNEIAAVEADCMKALSSFQKWKIIAQNCNSMGVSRPLDQCRRKWDALILEYKGIKQWESKSGGSDSSYWGLEVGRRKRNDLPESFDLEVFKAIDTLARDRESQSDTEPDTEPESDAEAEAVAESEDDEPVVAEPEPKRRRGSRIENSVKRLEVEKAEETHAEKPVRSCLEVAPHKIPASENPQKSAAKKKQKRSQTKQEAFNIEKQEQSLVMKLHENAALIRAIVSEKPDHEAAGVKSTGDLHTDFVRCQGDQIIACLGDIVKALRHLAHGCE